MGIDVQWTAFPLHPETPLEGRTLEELFAGRGFDIPAMLARLKATADELELPFGERSMTYNSRRAQEMGKWAEDMGRGEPFHLAVFRAYFARGRNIARPDVLKAVAEAAGLDGAEALRVLESGKYTLAVDEDWHRSRQLNVTAVPTFRIDGRMLTGAQRCEVLKEFIVHGS